MNEPAADPVGDMAPVGSGTPEPCTLLDLSGLRCPVPIVKLNAAIRDLAPGAALEVRATDPAFELDVQAWCRRTGNALVDLGKSPGVLVARIRKAG